MANELREKTNEVFEGIDQLMADFAMSTILLDSLKEMNSANLEMMQRFLRLYDRSKELTRMQTSMMDEMVERNRRLEEKLDVLLERTK